MELLKFSEGQKNSRRGKNPAGFIGAGIMVAVMGLSSTLAGTIAIGSGTVEFGQGVVSTAACDTSITLTPTSSYSYSSDTFTVSTFTVEGIGGNVIAGPPRERGCLGQVLEFRAYDSSGNLLDFSTGVNALTITIPSSIASTETDSKYTVAGFLVNNGTIGTSPVTESVTVQAAVDGIGSGQGFNNTSSSATAQGKFIVGGISVSGTVTRITIESRGPRTGIAAEAAQS